MNYEISLVSNLDSLLLRELRILGGRCSSCELPPYLEYYEITEINLPTLPVSQIDNQYQYTLPVIVIPDAIPYLMFISQSIQPARLLSRISSLNVTDSVLSLYAESPTLPQGIRIRIYWIKSCSGYTKQLFDLDERVRALEDRGAVDDI